MRTRIPSGPLTRVRRVPGHTDGALRIEVQPLLADDDGP